MGQSKLGQLTLLNPCLLDAAGDIATIDDGIARYTLLPCEVETGEVPQLDDSLDVDSALGFGF
jgi:hypothetical protein